MHQDKQAGPEPVDEMALRARTPLPPFLIARAVPGVAVTDWQENEAEMAAPAFQVDPAGSLHCRGTIEKRYRGPLHSLREAEQAAQEGLAAQAGLAERGAREAHPEACVLAADQAALMALEAQTAMRVPPAQPVTLVQRFMNFDLNEILRELP